VGSCAPPLACGLMCGASSTYRRVRAGFLTALSCAAATESAEDVPRTLDFLFSRNRLNVAVSRAMCLARIVASPRLLESRARTIEQMRLINALCRFAELAAEQTASTARRS
jgi:hypothetical protein